MHSRKILSILAGVFASSLVFSQVNVQWVARYTTAGNNIDRAKSMVVDASGNSYVVGTSWNGTDFDIVTTRFDANGNFVWATPYNGPGNGYDEARAIVIDNAGNVYVTGYSAGAASNYDIVTIKYNSAGSQQWATRFDGTAAGFDEGYDIAVDGSGNVYVTGGTTSTTGGNNYVTIKYNPAGVQQWATVYNNNNNNTECAYAITLDGSGNVYVTGSSYGGSANDNDMATIKYNNSGTQQWAKRYNGPGSVYDAGSDIIVDGAGNVYVTGYARDLVGTTNYSYATVMYNSAGTQQWASIYDGTGNDYDAANAITLTPAGNVAVTGHSIGTTSTAEDMATVLYNGTNGNVIWVRRFDGGAVQYDEGTAVSADSSNRIYVTGYSYAPGTNNNYLTVKYEANGDTSWIVKYNGPGNNSDQAYSMALGPTSEVYVGGMSKGAGTNEDYAVVKYCQLRADAGLDTAICLGASVQLNVTSSYMGISNIAWSPAGSLSQSNITNPVATPSVTTDYVVALTNTLGCTDLDTVRVTVIPLPGPQITSSGPTSFCIGGSVTLTANDTTGGNVSYLWSNGDTTASTTVNSSGTYSVTITNGNTCSSQSTATVTVNPLPNISAGNDTNLCASSTINLCATGGTSYSWTPSFGLSDTTLACPVAGPTQSTTYIVYGTDANGCSSSDTVVVGLYPPPSVPIISQNIAVLSSTPASTYQWYFGATAIPGATGQNYTPTQNGQYYVEITDANGCSAFSAPYTINDVGFADLSSGTNDLSIFPNPNNGTMTLDIPQNGQKGTLDVYSLAGQKVYSMDLGAAAINHLDLQLSLDAGNYFVTVTLEDGTRMVKRIVIQN
ncbi:MAG TPA: SBBP repeat-containing protein [Bacteroidia bacterium]|nr:SBBP repeat-containing protein [Bacteroidia bacterium]